MCNIVTIIPFSIDLKTRDINILFEVNDSFIQNNKVDDNQFDIFLSDIISKYLEIHADWVKFFLVDVKQVEQSSSVDIIYTCLIPEQTRLLSGKWVKIQDINGDKNELIKLAIKKVWH